MENLRTNKQLKNAYIRNRFKLHLIREEQDLQQYKNLLNAMAALFYTNHCPQMVQDTFSMWRQAFQQAKAQKKQKPKVPNLAIEKVQQID